jgi:hypothetical protein
MRHMTGASVNPSRPSPLSDAITTVRAVTPTLAQVTAREIICVTEESHDIEKVPDIRVSNGGGCGWKYYGMKAGIHGVPAR